VIGIKIKTIEKRIPSTNIFSPNDREKILRTFDKKYLLLGFSFGRSLPALIDKNIFLTFSQKPKNIFLIRVNNIVEISMTVDPIRIINPNNFSKYFIKIWVRI